MAAYDCGVRLGNRLSGHSLDRNPGELRGPGRTGRSVANEKVALEVAIGVAFAGARAIVTMKHVGLNVAADPLFTVAAARLDGALVVVSADDPGMASKPERAGTTALMRRFAGVAMLEPSDSQEAYEFTVRAIEISSAGRRRCCCA